jgi:excinuclease ABC subunit A
VGGKVVFAGTPEEMLKADTLTAAYLNRKEKIEIPQQRRKGNGKQIVIKGASGNNLKNVNVTFPRSQFICVTGVSGSGKSTLINETLQPILSAKLYHSLQDPLPYKSIVIHRQDTDGKILFFLFARTQSKIYGRRC